LPKPASFPILSRGLPEALTEQFASSAICMNQVIENHTGILTSLGGSDRT
jgi:hypothetical protein